MLKTKTMLLSLALLLTQVQLQAAADDSTDNTISEGEVRVLLGANKYALNRVESRWNIGGYRFDIPGYPQDRMAINSCEQSEISPLFLLAVRPFLLEQYRSKLKKIEPSYIKEYITQLEGANTSQHISEKNKQKLGYKRQQMEALLCIVDDAGQDKKPDSSIPGELLCGETPLNEVARIVNECNSDVKMIWIAELITKKDTEQLNRMLTLFDQAHFRLPPEDRTHVEQFYIGEQRNASREMKKKSAQLTELQHQCGKLEITLRATEKAINTLHGWDQESDGEST